MPGLGVLISISLLPRAEAPVSRATLRLVPFGHL
jgi:hypothetical protein